jgi:hypothetical protein
VAAYSDYNYIRPAELPEILVTMASVTDESMAARFISDAEHIIDAYVGPAPKFYIDGTGQSTALLASGATTFFGNRWGNRHPNFWARGGVYVEIVDNAPAAVIGQQRLIVASDDDVVTLASGFSAAIPAGALFNFTQRSRFPRWRDRMNLDMPDMPPELKRATAFQVEYGFLFGSEQFGLSDQGVADGESTEIQSRSYASGYAESRAVGSASSKRGLALLIAPRARAELRNLLGVTGYLRG